MIYRTFLKQIFDFLIALLILLLTSPVLLVVIIILYYSNNGKIFFLQARPGKAEKIFNIIKFKTMNDKMDINGVLLQDNLRLTSIGKIIRKTSLDELPQLINVLKGQMSLVGPRPLLPEYLPIYTEEQKKRHNVKPGITGWAQVNGRNAISWGRKFEYDIYYVNNLSFKLDVKIILLTIKKIIYREGVNASETITMEKFNGKN